MSKRKPRTPITSPLVWPIWAFVGLCWLIARLPMPVVFAIGSTLGRVIFFFAPSRRQITRTNLRLCFPELSSEERETMLREVFIEIGIGAVETMVPWLNPAKDIRDRFDIEGLHHLRDAEAQGRGVLLLGGHFACMDVISPVLGDLKTVDVMYRENRNPVWEWLQVNGRKHYFDGVIERDDTRQTLKRLRAGRTLWYAPDQDYGARHSVFAPFFGIRAASITATSRLARFNKSPVLMLVPRRDRAAGRWCLHFSPVLEGFPGDDEMANATRVNQLIEAAIR
ncbi:MAG: lipid A biosynthesis lauroyl acyltransferase, partial [Proteobacteria bacterium]|nr:lipid A biosynthesis lauroyl acyltransferase [Pseudomonadota bacterium]